MPGSTGGRDRRRRARPADRWVLPGRARHIVTLAVTAVVLAGCGGTSEPPVTLAPLTGSPSSTPTPSPTGSTTPSASSEDAAIEAAVRAYYQAMDLALSTGDTGPYLAATNSDCPCRSFATAVQKAFDEGEVTGAKIELKTAVVVAVRGDTATVAASYSTAEYTVQSPQGSETYEAARVSSQLRMVLRDSRWVVTNDNLLEAEPA